VKTLLGTKRGMTQMWREDGSRVPVTILDVEPNLVTAIRTEAKDGYQALQLGVGSIRPKVVAKPQRVQAEKAGLELRRHVREVRGEVGEAKVGDVLTVSLFEPGSKVDVIGTSKGKGFAGTIKKHHFARGPVSHGSQNVRRPGSIGMHTHPGRTLRGKRMATRMGNERITIKGLDVMAVDEKANQLLVKGAVPGAIGGLVMVRATNLVRKGGKP